MIRKTGIIMMLVAACMLLLASCQMETKDPNDFTVPYIMRGEWENEDGTASVTATEKNIILDYDYVPGASMNLDQMLDELNGVYTVETTNTTLTVHSDSMGLTMYRFIVSGDIMTIDINLTERLVMTRQSSIGG